MPDTRERLRANVITAARMYEMQKTAKNLFGERYAANVAQWIEVIAAAQARHKLDVIAALLHLHKEAEAKGFQLSEMDTLLMTAAAVEMCETDQILEGLPNA